MNDRQLRSFVKAAELKSFSKAAAVSFITAPAMINQINLLEKDIQVALFERGPQGIQLTPQGEIFYNAAVEMLRIYDEALSKCHEKEEKNKLILKIGG